MHAPECAISLSLTLFLSLTHSLTLSHSLTHSLTLTHSLSLSLSHTHTHTHTHSLSLSVVWLGDASASTRKCILQALCLPRELSSTHRLWMGRYRSPRAVQTIALDHMCEVFSARDSIGYGKLLHQSKKVVGGQEKKRKKQTYLSYLNRLLSISPFPPPPTLVRPSFRPTYEC